MAGPFDLFQLSSRAWVIQTGSSGQLINVSCISHAGVRFITYRLRREKTPEAGIGGKIDDVAWI